MADRVSNLRRGETELRPNARIVREAKVKARKDRTHYDGVYRLTRGTVQGNKHTSHKGVLPVLHGDIVRVGQHVTIGGFVRTANRA